MLGDRNHEAIERRARELLALERVPQAEVLLRRAGEGSLDVNALRKDISEELKRTLVAQVQSNDARLQQLQAAIRGNLFELATQSIVPVSPATRGGPAMEVFVRMRDDARRIRALHANMGRQAR